MSVLLEARNVSKSFGEFRALEDVNIAIAAGELVSVIGPNGAGKTTLVNLLTGLLRPTTGDVLFMGREHCRHRSGRGLPIGAGTLVSAHRRFSRSSPSPETICAALVVAPEKALAAILAAWLPTPRWPARRRGGATSLASTTASIRPAAALSQGEKKLLDVASAFALDPQVILLDEPTSGVSTADKHGIMKTLIAAGRRRRRQGHRAGRA